MVTKYIELIDKYVIEQRQPSEMSEYGSDMNPPNYIWTDNTGELVRCGDCEAYKPFVEWLDPNRLDCDKHIIDFPEPDDYCSRGERRHGTEN